MKTKFSFADGPLKDCAPANGLSVDSALIGLEPVAGDKRFTVTWDRSRVGKGVVRAAYRYVKEGERVLAVHVPELDPKDEEPAAAAALPANG